MGSSSSIQKRNIFNKDSCSVPKSQVRQFFENEFEENLLLKDKSKKFIHNDNKKTSFLTSEEQDTDVLSQDKICLLSELFMNMCSSINNDGVFYCGEVSIGAKYVPDKSILQLKVIQAKRLLKRDRNQLPDPIVVVNMFLVSNPTELVTQKTTVKFQTCDPIFQELLTFPLYENDIANTQLHIVLKDNGLLKADCCLGEIKLNLSKLDFHNGQTMWFQLIPKIDLSITGNIDVSFSINQSNCLLLTIHSARGLRKSSGVCQFFVKHYLIGFPKKFQTKISLLQDPIWEESFEFDIHSNDLERRVFLLEVFNQDGTEEIYEGGVYIHLDSLNITTYSRGQNSYQLQDLRNIAPPKSKYGKEGIAMELYEAGRAHITYRAPGFLCNRDNNGTKVITVHCEKANAYSKAVLVDGIPLKQTLVF
ncbi:synaptotagmin-9 isoform X1 [Hydra vulgaris]|uniref:synaptotagmin-9 isoform X1 n=2 Tax=Hydra vulgaris TaxID=6087 RepID=UPI001F5F7C90|nr:synaptotagmin-9 isoform X1 [Hydra vulgaris]